MLSGKEVFMNVKKATALLLATLCVFTGFAGKETVMAAQTSKPYIALGADLSDTEKSTVLSLLEVDSQKLNEYTVVTVTNQEERKYLGNYLDAKVIGTRALSSVLVEESSSGSGIQVKTNNITYCTTGMYQNALATAGLKNATIHVVGPFNISGTAALVGAMKAYSSMTGQVLQPENTQVATEELVTTSELGQTLDNQEKAEELIGIVKEAIISQDITTPQEIEATIDEAADKLDIHLTQEDIEKIKSLMEKLGNLDIDVNSLKEQVKDLYNKLEEMNLNITKEDVEGFLGTILSWLRELWHSIQQWLGYIK